ncbi:MAG: superoxide dismutase, Fe-Mn family [Candidatus Parcubacteria bacterium]|jgi:Fe-Mn family superoxide dismutase|nr:superoxide dismutase, Fe-Mn family [Candidatus Parcubacteria bacterium]
MTYTARTFDLPELKGLSKEQITVHLALYEGYVKHTNLIMEKIARLKETDAEGNAYLINELRRRFGFEFDGMRMHEYYFEQFEGGAAATNAEAPLADAAKEKYGDWNGFIAHIKEVTGTRGIGWVVVAYDPKGRTLHTAWVDDHQLGQLSGLPIVLALDLWEHAYMVDYKPKDKNLYVEAFLENLNWSVIENRFLSAAV